MRNESANKVVERYARKLAPLTTKRSAREGDWKMRKWEYKLVDSKDVPSDGMFKGRNRAALEAYLNQLGADGWELVNIDSLELEGRTEFVGVAKRERAQ